MGDLTYVKLSNGDTVDLAMSAEELRAALIGAGELVQLRQQDGHPVFINPKHIVVAYVGSKDDDLAMIDFR